VHAETEILGSLAKYAGVVVKGRYDAEVVLKDRCAGVYTKTQRSLHCSLHWLQGRSCSTAVTAVGGYTLMSSIFHVGHLRKALCMCICSCTCICTCRHWLQACRLTIHLAGTAAGTRAVNRARQAGGNIAVRLWLSRHEGPVPVVMLHAGRSPCLVLMIGASGWPARRNSFQCHKTEAATPVMRLTGESATRVANGSCHSELTSQARQLNHDCCVGSAAKPEQKLPVVRSLCISARSRNAGALLW
jgi:hypothetical protein